MRSTVNAVCNQSNNSFAVRAKTSKLLVEHKISLTVDKKAKKYLATKGYSEEYGARPLRRLIKKGLCHQSNHDHNED